MFFFYILSLLFAGAKAHSWVACADYDVRTPKSPPLMGSAETDPARLTYDPTKCHAYARGWSHYAAPFGTDRGANYQIQGLQTCQSDRNAADAYTALYPAPVYRAGQTVCFAHPAKNHVADTCTNPFIPDSQYSIYLSAVNPKVDPQVSEMTELHHYNGVHQNGVIDHKGFQNCPRFCEEGMDKATCTVCFDLPSNIVSGEYLLVWFWIFNQGTPAYSSCVDARIIGSGEPGPAPQPAPQPVTQPVMPVAQPVPQPQPKPVVTQPVQQNCFCKCVCNGLCYKKCSCSTPGASTTCPICQSPAIVPNPVPTNCRSAWAQCGGQGFTGGSTCCDAAYSCKVINPYYSQCVPR